MPDVRVWVIRQYDEPIAAFDNEEEARKEHAYLSYHGDGYQLKELPLESKAGGYTNMDGCPAVGVGGVHSDSYFDQRSCKWCGEQGAQR